MSSCVRLSSLPLLANAHGSGSTTQSLSLKPDDTFTCEMLTEALKDALDEPADPTDLDQMLAPPPGAIVGGGASGSKLPGGGAGTPGASAEMMMVG